MTICKEDEEFVFKMIEPAENAPNEALEGYTRVVWYLNKVIIYIPVPVFKAWFLKQKLAKSDLCFYI
jgi:hypothetical protein